MKTIVCAVLAALVLSTVVPPLRAASPVQYLEFEGDAQGQQAGVTTLKQVFGPIRRHAPHLYAYGIGELPLLTRSVASLRALVNQAFDIAEREDVPVEFHLDPQYGFGADTEASAHDAPRIKYWNDPQMREWSEFPVNGRLPTRIPRIWFNWGAWESPAPAFPAFGSPKFLQFAAAQVRDGIARPIAQRLRRLERVGRGYLFAGINVGWETSIPVNRGIDPAALPTSADLPPPPLPKVTMRPWEVGVQLGYASLSWQGWTEPKLQAEAKRRGVTRDALFNDLCYHVIHDYTQTLAKACHDQGLARDHLFTHQVPMATVNPGGESTTMPPIWVAVNPYATPGFTMDNRGAAVYDLAALKRQIEAADPSEDNFAVSESYLSDYRDGPTLTALLSEQFGSGGVIKCLYGVFPAGRQPFGLDPKPENDTLAIIHWLNAGSS